MNPSHFGIRQTCWPLDNHDHHGKYLIVFLMAIPGLFGIFVQPITPSSFETRHFFRLFFVYFCLFKQTLPFLQQINVNKCPSSIRSWDSNPRPSEHVSPPITTRPGLPPYNRNFLSEGTSYECYSTNGKSSEG